MTATRTSILERYSEGAKARQEDLCCPVDYDRRLLEALPGEIVERDYGCGDPSRYVRAGDTVLDLGSGGGKICYMAAQLVGDTGRVIGVDMNDDMLALARKYRGEMAARLGGDRVEFRKGLIQDLALDLEATEGWLSEHPVTDAAGLMALQDRQAAQRREAPMIADESVDLVISNCVLNLVEERDRRGMIAEICRVLKPHGRVAISDIVADEPVPDELKKDPQLWSGCISGAFHEKAFLDAFVEAGFVGVGYDKWQAEPWRTVGGIEFRAVTLVAAKPAGGARVDRGHAVIYRGPFAEVRDDEGHVFPRGERMAVCAGTYRLLTEGPYADDFVGIPPPADAGERTWCAPPGARRPAAGTKGGRHRGGDGGGCC